MPSTRTYQPILRSFNNASVAMPSHATASRIPTPVARVPIAIARSIPRPVNSLSVARKYTPTVQRARPSTTVTSMASSFAAMSISNTANQAIASPSAPKPISPLPCVAVPRSKLASDRIQARRQRVIANLQAPKKRATAPASIPQSSSMPSRALPPPVIAPVSILKSRTKPSRVIPPPLAHAPPSTLVSSWRPRPSFEPRQRRGMMPYCQGRPCTVDENGNNVRGDYQPQSYFGIKCTCHGGNIPIELWIRPHLWETTPAEADVDPKRRRIVRFADNPVRSTRTFRPWYNEAWSPPERSQDDATEAEDDAAIRAMDNPPAVAAITNPLPSSSNFESTWQALMDEGFPDDDVYF
ncbi:hypothetical protein IMSHALPRED_009464 [Imshaugia aleurites]|uniref:Uncharacterized protein n=1 Tax=Imshaugia aleurites TaxID=172621 RepID=A0A8H3FZZ8_9LECA|nr:hypothetical protein IMSHALPRED_009464 [Imshaugia aleurites]